MKFLMKCAVAAFAVLTLISGGALAQASAAAKADVEKTVREFVAAYGGGPATLEKYFSYYADDMTVMYAPGRRTKQGYYDFWKPLNDRGGGVTTAAVEDLQIQIGPSNDVAVATFLMPVTRRGELTPNQTRDTTWNMSTTWFKQPDGRWIVKSIAYFTRTPPAAPAPAAAPATR